MKTRKLLSLALALVLLVGLAAPALALEYGQEYIGYTAGGGQQYKDVPDGFWAKASIETCSQRGWFNGYPDGTFRPNGLIRRDEAAKVFAVAMGLTLEDDPQVTYTDTADSWAKAHIEATKALFPNVANLQGTASFRPNQTITREETIYALLVAWRYASKTTNADLSILNMFSDQNSISAGVRPYVAVAVSEGLVSGLPDGTIAAQKGLTRAEFATLLARALSHGYGSDTTDTPVITVNRYAAETTEARVTLTGKVSPVSTGTKLTLDGESVALTNGSFKVTVDLALGENSFTLESKNSYGVRDSKTVRITRVEPEPEPSPEPVPSPTPDPEPSKQPDPVKDPEPTKDPQPSKNPDPVKDPEPSKQPEPSKTPDPVKDPEPSKEPDKPAEPEREVVRSGKCGNKSKWVFYADGELAILGSGSMGVLMDIPWEPYVDQIASVTIEDSITDIASHAFSGLNISEVHIPDSVTKIGAYSFQGTNLTKVVIPKRVTEVWNGAFDDCKDLVEVSFPRSLQSIGWYTFSGCVKLTDIHYSGSALNWGDIEIGPHNDPLNDANLHYNSTGN